MVSAAQHVTEPNKGAFVPLRDAEDGFGLRPDGVKTLSHLS